MVNALDSTNLKTSKKILFSINNNIRFLRNVLNGNESGNEEENEIEN